MWNYSWKIKIIVFAKNHCEIQVHTILVCKLYSIKCDICLASRHATYVDYRKPPSSIQKWDHHSKIPYKEKTIEQHILGTVLENNFFKPPQMSNSHWCWNNEQHLNVDYNFKHQMFLNKSKCLYSKNCLHFLKCALPLTHLANEIVCQRRLCYTSTPLSM